MYDDGVCGIEISSLPIDVWHMSMLYRYDDILTGDRMIVGISNSVRLATGFDGFMPSHSLAPVMIPQIWVVTAPFGPSKGLIVTGNDHSNRLLSCTNRFLKSTAQNHLLYS